MLEEPALEGIGALFPLLFQLVYLAVEHLHLLADALYFHSGLFLLASQFGLHELALANHLLAFIFRGMGLAAVASDFGFCHLLFEGLDEPFCLLCHQLLFEQQFLTLGCLFQLADAPVQGRDGGFLLLEVSLGLLGVIDGGHEVGPLASFAQ